MYGTIYKVQRDLTKDFERIREEDYYDNGFLNHIGDFVDEDTDVLDDYEHLEKEHPEIYKVNIDGTIEDSNDGKEMPLAYLTIDAGKAKKYINEELAKYVNKVSKDPEFALTLAGEEMIQGDSFGTYIDIDGTYITLHKFLIWVSNFFEGEVVFRLEGTLDYHY